jgi:hypothetical protein
MKVGNKQAEIIMQTQDSIQILSPNVVKTGEMDSAVIEVNVNGKTFTIDNCFSFVEDAAQPTITDISPASANPNLKTQLTITGTNFPTDEGMLHVELFRKSDNLKCECYVLPQFTTATEIKCAVPGGYSGEYDVYVNVLDLGYAANDAGLTFSFGVEVTGFSPNTGSMMGGTEITITGSNFSPVAQ